MAETDTATHPGNAVALTSASPNTIPPTTANMDSTPVPATMEEKPATGFLDLPPELREKIYDLAINEVYKPNAYVYWNEAIKRKLAILYTCRQVRAEMLPIYRDRLSLYVKIDTPKLKSFATFLEACDEANFAVLKSLTFSLPFPAWDMISFEIRGEGKDGQLSVQKWLEMVDARDDADRSLVIICSQIPLLLGEAEDELVEAVQSAMGEVVNGWVGSEFTKAGLQDLVSKLTGVRYT